MASLKRAIALAEMNATPMGIEEHLDLDVTPTFDEPLEDEPVVSERRQRLSTRRRQSVEEAIGIADLSHALATATGGRLDEDGIPDPSRGNAERIVRLIRVVVADECRDAERAGQPSCRGLVTHGPDRRRWWTDPADARALDQLGEVGVLGQEPESGVQPVGTDPEGGGDDRRRIEEVERAGIIGLRHHRTDRETVARAADPRCDLATIGDKERPDRPIAHLGGAGDRAKRDKCVICDTPLPTNASRRQLAGRDPALDRPRGRPQALGYLARV